MLACLARHELNTLKRPQAGLSNISAVLHSNSGLVPLAARNYTLRHENGTVLNGKTDAEGYLEHRDVTVGDYVLEIDGIKSYVPTVSNPSERLPIRVRGYYLIHKCENRGLKKEVLRPETEDDDVTDEANEDDWESLDETEGDVISEEGE